MHLGIMMKLPLRRDLNVNGVLPVLRSRYLEQCGMVNALIRRPKEAYYSTLIQENAHDPKVLFKVFDRLLQRSASDVIQSLVGTTTVYPLIWQLSAAVVCQHLCLLMIRKGRISSKATKCGRGCGVPGRVRLVARQISSFAIIYQQQNSMVVR